MRRFLPIPLVLMALAAGCEAPTPTAPLGASPAFAKAGTTTTNEWVEIDRSYFNSCTNEEVLLTGKAHMRITTTTSADGSTRTTLHLNYANVTGVGVVTGLKYQLVAAAKQELVVTTDPVTQELFTHQNAALVSQGSADNYKEHVTLRVTFTETGTETEIIRNNVGCER